MFIVGFFVFVVLDVFVVCVVGWVDEALFVELVGLAFLFAAR